MIVYNYLKQSADFGASGGLGGAIGSIIPALIVVGLFQINQKYRNERSRWNVFAWSQFVFFLGTVGSIISRIGNDVNLSN